MAYVLREGGSYGANASVIQIDSSQHSASQHSASQHNAPQLSPSPHPALLEYHTPQHAVTVPDADLLFNGAYHRAGPDLVITGHDGAHFLVAGYFSSEHPPALMAPNGASLTGDVVSLMAGSPAPGHYAQAQPTAPPDAIGKVEKVVGDVTAVRNGVAVTLHVGDAVFKSDVVQTGAGSSVGISFPDGSAFNLVANTRMALTEYSYDPNSNSNVSLFTLVQGTFAFVAGKVAHSGDMKIETPVATMGIRGTTGVVEQEPSSTVTSNLGQVTYTFAVVKDFGTDVNGAYTLCYLDRSTGACNVFTTIGQVDYVTYVTPLGVGVAPDVRVEPITTAQFAFEQEILQQLFQTLNPTNQQNNGSNGSSTFQEFTPPNENPQLFEPPPTIQNFVFNFDSGSPPPPTTTTPLVLPPPPTLTTVVVWVGPSGNWVTPPDWSDGAVPGSVNTVEILTPVTVTINNSQSVNELEIVGGAILDIVTGGSLTVFSSITGAGTVELNAGSGDPTLWIDGTVKLTGGGTIELTGSPSGDNNILGVGGTNAKLVNVDYLIEGAGNIGAGDGHLTFINCGTVNANASGQTLDIHTGNTVENGDTTVAPDATPIMEATGGGTLRIEDDVSNLGMITALTGGVLQFESITVANASAGEVQVGVDSTLDLDGASVLGGTFDNQGDVFVTGSSVLHTDALTNEGDIFVGAGAALTLEGDTTLFNAEGALIEADGEGAKITVEIVADANVNSGTMLAVNGGEIDFEINVKGGSNHGLIEAGKGGTVVFNDNHSGSGTSSSSTSGGGEGGNYGTMEADHGGLLIFNGGLDNFDLVEAVAGGTVDLNKGIKNHAGTVLSTGDGSLIAIKNGESSENADTILATLGGVITFSSVLLTNDAGATVAATDGGAIDYTTGSVSNDGTFKADGGTITFGGDIGITNNADGTFLAAGGGSIFFGGDSGSVTNDGGHITANGGTITFDSSLTGVTNENGGVIAAGAGGTVIIDGFAGGNGLENAGGFITADGDGATVELDGATIIGGTVESSDGGVIETTLGTSTFLNVTIADGTVVETLAGTTLDLEGTTTVEDTVTFKGDGTFVLTGAGAAIIGSGKDAGLDNQGTITGAGAIGNAGATALALSNEGNIDANVADGTLTIETGGTDINTGLMEATNGGALAVEDVVDNDGGAIGAFGAGSEVELANATINDGTVKSSDGGVVETTLGTSTFFDVTITDGTVVETLAGTFLNLEGTTRLGDTVTFEGDGTFVLTGDDAQIVGIGDGAALNNEGTITGAGAIGNGGENSLDLTNEHIINANVADGTLIIETGSLVANTGTMEATNGGTLAIDDSVNNVGGTIGASGAGSDVKLKAGITISGGTLATDDRRTNAGGMIEILAAAAAVMLDGTAGHAVTIDGYVKVDDGASLALEGTIHNDGNVDVDVVVSGATLLIDGKVDLDGSGTVTLDGSGDKIVAGIGGGTLDNSSNIVGSGAIGSGDTSLKLVNESGGVIDANNNTTAPLIVDTGSIAISNAGTMEATEGGRLIIKSDVDNDGGTIGASGKGSEVDLEHVTITGGTLETTDKGVIAVMDGTSTFDDLAIADGSNVQVDIGASLVLEHTITNDGTITLLSGDDPNLIINGSVNLDGFGLIVLSGADDHIIGGSSGGTLYNDNDIMGSGTIGGHNLTLINLSSGIVDANGNSDALLVLDTDSHAVTNAGLLESTGGGTLEIKSGVDNIGGTIGSFDAGSDTKLFGVTVTGGTLATDADGMIEIVKTDIASAFDGRGDHAVTVDGYVQVDDGAQLELRGAIDILSGGTINVDEHDVATGAQLIIDGTVNLNGGGNVVLSGNDDAIVGDKDGDDDVLVNADTISGYGRIGDERGSLALTNTGTIDANLDGKTLVIDTEHTITNTGGTLEASHGGTLLVDDVVKGGNALIEGGTMVFDAKASLDCVSFDNSCGYGDLVLKDWSQFTGTISGFTGTAGDASHSDEITLVDFDDGRVCDSASYNSTTNITTLTVWDGADCVTLKFVGDYATDNFVVKQDGDNVDIFDPPTASLWDGSSTTNSGGIAANGESNGWGASTGYGLNFANDQIKLGPADAASGQNGSLPAPSQVGAGGDNFVFHSTLTNDSGHSLLPLVEFGSGNDGGGQPVTPVHAPIFDETIIDHVVDGADALTAQFHQVVASVTHLH